MKSFTILTLCALLLSEQVFAASLLGGDLKFFPIARRIKKNVDVMRNQQAFEAILKDAGLPGIKTTSETEINFAIEFSTMVMLEKEKMLGAAESALKLGRPLIAAELLKTLFLRNSMESQKTAILTRLLEEDRFELFKEALIHAQVSNRDYVIDLVRPRIHEAVRQRNYPVFKCFVEALSRAFGQDAYFRLREVDKAFFFWVYEDGIMNPKATGLMLRKIAQEFVVSYSDDYLGVVRSAHQDKTFEQFKSILSSLNLSIHAKEQAALKDENYEDDTSTITEEDLEDDQD